MKTKGPMFFCLCIYVHVQLYKYIFFVKNNYNYEISLKGIRNEVASQQGI